MFTLRLSQHSGSHPAPPCLPFFAERPDQVCLVKVQIYCSSIFPSTDSAKPDHLFREAIQKDLRCQLQGPEDVDRMQSIPTLRKAYPSGSTSHHLLPSCSVLKNPEALNRFAFQPPYLLKPTVKFRICKHFFKFKIQRYQILPAVDFPRPGFTGALPEWIDNRNGKRFIRCGQ